MIHQNLNDYGVYMTDIACLFYDLTKCHEDDREDILRDLNHAIEMADRTRGGAEADLRDVIDQLEGGEV